jgi:hypothetical protein
MRGVSAVALLATLLFSSVAMAQEFREGNVGTVTEPFSIVVENGSGAIYNGGGQRFVSGKDRCEVRAGARVRIGGIASDKRKNLHYEVKSNRDQRGTACPNETMFRATDEELRTMRVHWDNHTQSELEKPCW